MFSFGLFLEWAFITRFLRLLEQKLHGDPVISSIQDHMRLSFFKDVHFKKRIFMESVCVLQTVKVLVQLRWMGSGKY